MLAIIRAVALLIHFIIVNLMLLLVCLARPFHRNNVHIAGQLYSTMAWTMGLKVTVRKAPDVNYNVPCVYLCNHQNSWDLVTVCKAAQPGTVVIGKKSLLWIPIFGQLFWLSGNIIIDRKNKGKAHNTLQYTAREIAEKRLSAWFFPEGTRSYGRGLLPFKSGAIRTAIQTNEPVVIVCASNLHNKIRWNRWDNGEMLIELQRPQPLTDDMTVKEWTEVLYAQMKSGIEKLDAEVAAISNSR
ncbi:1-acylglycerol-3-phosphate O-acyltransferase [Aestuariibacter salexigens]|uniref:1-acylglycerol-3-phosphate O-acyltransferase n=1 Tax=Aestuariibacter salexigens TaxID=226010 RepID=UPI000478D6EA|nr:1-acylglycerol-3-phosphate O-acyltransferase [Aestuariibacter salexigens]